MEPSTTKSSKILPDQVPSEPTHVHYGPSRERKLQEAEPSLKAGPVAVLVFHGMGQQVRYETISSVARAILCEAEKKGGDVEPLDVHLFQEGEEFLTRAEIAWSDSIGQRHEVHVYEAYW